MKKAFSILLILFMCTLPGVAQDTGETRSEPDFWTTSQETVDSIFASINGHLAPVLFFNVNPNRSEDATTIPLIIVMLLSGGIFFTFRFSFINIRMFGHALRVVRGHYDDPDDQGEISHFQALTSALSATVGLGNIAGVAVAISQGGPGAVFWMWVVAFFGMSSKFSSFTLAQMYRRISPEAKDHGSADAKHASSPGKQHVLGGPMIYLAEGMKDRFGRKGKPAGVILASLFAFFAIMGSLGGGNMFQGNQTFAIFGDVIFEQKIEHKSELLARIEAGDRSATTELAQAETQAQETKNALKRKYAWVGGLIMTVLVGLVIVGGIKRIGTVTSKLVPAMCLFYVGVCAAILIKNFGEIPAMMASIFQGAFSAKAVSWGGIMGVLVIGVKRGAFSNEAGLGSAAIAHSAAKTKEPVREGLVAMIGPFVDTIVVCTMTALAILITGAYKSGSTGNFTNEGVGITASAFSSLSPIFTYMLTIAVFVFAYSTMISWSYYGERASEYLFGHKGIKSYRVVFLFFVFISPMISLDNVIGFTDLLILSMAYPNILGMLMLSGKVAAKAKDYRQRLKNGEMSPTR
jgi:AGCS family alanine or glycine:cation symporter